MDALVLTFYEKKNTVEYNLSFSLPVMGYIGY